MSLHSVTGTKTVKVCFSFERTAHESLPLYGEHTLRRSDVDDIRFLFTKKWKNYSNTVMISVLLALSAVQMRLSEDETGSVFPVRAHVQKL